MALTIGFEALSVSLQSASSNMCSVFPHIHLLLMLTFSNEVKVAGLHVLSPLHHILICISAVLGWFQRAASWENCAWFLTSPLQMATVFMMGFLILSFQSSTSQLTLLVMSSWLAPIVTQAPLGMKWQEEHSVVMALPFGLQSVTYIFTATAG